LRTLHSAKQWSGLTACITRIQWGGCPIFPADNIWNYDISRRPVHPNSANFVAAIGLTSYLHPDFGAGLYNGDPATGQAWRQPIVNDELNRRIPDGARATTLSALSFVGTLAGIVLNPLIGRAGDLGLGITGVSIGLSLILLGLVVPFLVSRKRIIT
jgi:hypothetical protein